MTEGTIIATTLLDIEQGIEVPPRKCALIGKSPVYPFKFMNVGDSFFVPCEDNKRSRKQSTILQAARRAPEGWKYVTRQVDGGVRCWRAE